MGDPVVISERTSGTYKDRLVFSVVDGRMVIARQEMWTESDIFPAGVWETDPEAGVNTPREALAALVLSALPHLTGDELRRVAEAMPRVAGEWTEVDGEGSRFIGDDWTVAHVCNLGSDKRPRWEAWLDPEIDEAEPSTHPTARAAQAACDARLEAAGVRLCGEVVRDG